MKKKELQKIKDKGIVELEKSAQMLREEIARAQIEAKTNPPKDTNALSKKKKELAIVLTVTQEKKFAEKVKKQAS